MTTARNLAAAAAIGLIGAGSYIILRPKEKSTAETVWGKPAAGYEYQQENQPAGFPFPDESRAYATAPLPESPKVWKTEVNHPNIHAAEVDLGAIIPIVQVIEVAFRTGNCNVGTGAVSKATWELSVRKNATDAWQPAGSAVSTDGGTKQLVVGAQRNVRYIRLSTRNKYNSVKAIWTGNKHRAQCDDLLWWRGSATW